MKRTNTTPTHGLLTEDFRQNLFNLIQNHPLDIQTKAVILDSVLLAANITARQQTQKELEEYKQTNNSNTETTEKEAFS